MAPASTENRRLVLSERPKRGPITDKTFKLETVPVPTNLKEGEITVQVTHVSVDPTMRNWLNNARSYMRPVDIGEVMRASGIGRVVASRAAHLREGDLVYGTLGWQTYWTGSAKKVEKRSTPKGGKDIDHLGLFGVSGMTAYFGMFDIGRLKDGDVVCVSGAAGSVGLIASQIALAHAKCKVIAIAGSKEKCAELKKLGVHHVLDYKDPSFKKDFKACGLVDLYFDNVGGEILDMVLGSMKPYGRVVACGAIAAYNASKPVPIFNQPVIISMKLRVEGFIALDYASRYSEGRAYLATLVQKGQMKYDYTVLAPNKGEKDGLGRCVEGLELMFAGKNYGKMLIQIADDQPRSKL